MGLARVDLQTWPIHAVNPTPGYKELGLSVHTMVWGLLNQNSQCVALLPGLLFLAPFPGLLGTGENLILDLTPSCHILSDSCSFLGQTLENGIPRLLHADFQLGSVLTL